MTATATPSLTRTERLLSAWLEACRAFHPRPQPPPRYLGAGPLGESLTLPITPTAQVPADGYVVERVTEWTNPEAADRHLVTVLHVSVAVDHEVTLLRSQVEGYDPHKTFPRVAIWLAAEPDPAALDVARIRLQAGAIERALPNPFARARVLAQRWG